MSVIIALFFVGIFSLSMTIPVSAERKDEVWYYENFTPEQRKNVRIAMDYAIPRDQIIASVLQGLGTKIASPVEANDDAYDASVVARDYNITKALDHMELAFGYRYNASAETDEERLGYFSMTLMAPTSRDDRMEWAALTTKTFQEIGIDVTLKYAGWNIALSRAWAGVGEGEAGRDYEHGGYDGFFLGWTGDPGSNVGQWASKKNWLPDGSNLGYVDNAVEDEIISRCVSNPDPAVRTAAFNEFQQWFKDNLPYFIMVQLDDLWAIDVDLKGVSFSFDYPNVLNWTHPDSIVTIQSPADFDDLNPMMISSYYDNLATAGIYEALITRDGASQTVWRPQIAESWSSSADGLTWTYKISDGIKFSDGSACTVDDVIFSYKKYIDPAVVAWGGTDAASRLNVSSIVRVNDSAVSFTLNEFYAYAEGFTGGLPIVSETELGSLTGPEWSTHASNVDYAPLGTGPYYMVKADSNKVAGYTTLELNTHYDDALRDPRYVNPNKIPTIKTKVVAGGAAAVAELASGAINVIDSNVALQPFRDEINSSTYGDITQTLGWGHQGFYVNNVNPIWGMNPIDPREMYPEDYTGSAPFDLLGVFFGLLMLAGLQMLRKRK